MTGRRAKLITLALLVTLVLNGCWSRHEMNDIGLVTMLGIDLTDDGQLEATVAVALPGAGGGSGQTGGAPTGPGKKLILVRRGETITEALRFAELAAPRELNMTHTEVIVLGERLADSGLDAYLDYLMRHPQIRLTAMIMILRGAPVARLFESEPVMESLQSQALQKLAVSHAGLVTRLWEYFRAKATDHLCPMIPTLDLLPHPTAEAGAPHREAELAGAALIKNDRVAEYVGATEIRGAMWLTQRARGAVITVPCVQGDRPGETSMRVEQASHKIRPLLEGGRVAFTVNISGVLRVTEIHCAVNLEDPAVIGRLERNAENVVGERVQELLRETQRHSADPFGFGDRARVAFPGLWNRIGGRPWGETWSTTPVTVKADLTIVYTGVSKEPITKWDK